MSADTLALLEEKVLRAVETVQRLRREKEVAEAAASSGSEQLRGQVRALEQRNAELTKELSGMRTERDVLQSEQDAVRLRIEGLLKQVESLGA